MCVNATATPVTPSIWRSSAVMSPSIFAFSGQPGTVSAISTDDDAVGGDLDVPHHLELGQAPAQLGVLDPGQRLEDRGFGGQGHTGRVRHRAPPPVRRDQVQSSRP